MENENSSAIETTDNRDLTDPSFLEELRIQMMKFAVLQIKDEALAEDAVQEAFVGALKNIESFGRHSALKTWVFAILKNKIKDSLRKTRQLTEISQQLPDPEDDSIFDTLFNANGRWLAHERPIAWVEPLEAIKNDHFWRVFEICLNNLPEKQARPFMMREFLELESTEICDTLNITANNLYVTLYRARLGLRECLEDRWFADKAKAL